MSATFIAGLQLSRIFYEEAVGPIFAARFPGLTYAAGRIDSGSDVLGFDTPRSMDHWWGPRVSLFLRNEDYTDDLAVQIREVMANQLPFEVRGFPTHLEVIDQAATTVFMTRRTTDVLSYPRWASRLATVYR